MIYVSRRDVPVPLELLARARKKTEELAEFADSGGVLERRLPIDAKVIRSFARLLEQLFKGKCAFCEVAINGISGAQIDQFRPRSDARQLTGETSPLHYYWLAYEWTNLYSICPVCNKNKGSLFPVDGPRSEPFGSIDTERRLLIDPCVDDPEQHLQFGLDGSVRGLDALGEATIEVFGLKRPALLETRRQIAYKTRMILEEYFRSPATAKKLLRKEISRMISGERAHTAVARAIVRELAVHDNALQTLLPKARVIEAGVSLPTTPKERSVRLRRVRRIKPSTITEVEIEGFRAIEHLHFTISDSATKWKVFLGENSTGKTSLLQAISLALLGETETSKHDPSGWLTRKGRKTLPSGFVKVQLSNEPEPIHFRFTKDDVRFLSGEWGAATFVRGYGSVRLSREGGNPTAKTKNVGNLWNAKSLLPNAAAFIAEMPAAHRTAVLTALRDLFLLDEETPINLSKGKLEIPLHGTTFTTEELSAGYLDVFNIFADIIAGFPGDLRDMANAFGIVLVDELGAHLHPRWKMQIVASLKNCFPGIQFLVTTHDPLCLRDIDSDEIVVMERREHGVQAITAGLPSPRYLRVDQLLTSRFFGLQSTVDPRMDEDLREYYRLLKDKERSEADEQSLRSLRNLLNRVSALGTSRREQIVYELVDQFLADELARGSDAHNIGIDEELKHAVKFAWQSAIESGELL